MLAVAVVVAGVMGIAGCDDKTIIIVPDVGIDLGAERTAAYDANAKALVRNAMTAVESAYIDVRDFSALRADDLAAVEPSIEWILSAAISSLEIAANPEGMVSTAEDQVAYYADSPTIYACGTESESGTTFGVIVDKGGFVNTWYVDGAEGDW